MSIMEYNGGACIAMVGKDCVAIASDKRFGVQAQTVGFDFEKVFRIQERTFVGLTGLATDVQTMCVPVSPFALSRSFLFFFFFFSFSLALLARKPRLDSHGSRPPRALWFAL